jgi:hypothetical protein
MEAIAACNSVLSLDLRPLRDLSDASLTLLSRGCPNLQELKICFGSFTAAGAKALTNANFASTLVRLSIESDEYFEDDDVANLHHFTNLEDLELIFHESSIIGGLSRLLESYPNMKRLSLNCMGDSVMETIGRTCTNLENLIYQPTGLCDFGSIPTGEGMHMVVVGCPQLKEICIPTLNDDILAMLATHAPQLESLRVLYPVGTGDVWTEGALFGFTRGCRNLLRLNFDDLYSWGPGEILDSQRRATGELRPCNKCRLQRGIA